MSVSQVICLLKPKQKLLTWCAASVSARWRAHAGATTITERLLLPPSACKRTSGVVQRVGAQLPLKRPQEQRRWPELRTSARAVLHGQQPGGSVGHPHLLSRQACRRAALRRLAPTLPGVEGQRYVRGHVHPRCACMCVKSARECADVCIDMCVQTCVSTCAHTCIQTCVHTCPQTCA